MVRVADCDHDSEESLVQGAARPWGWKRVAATASSVALLLAGAAAVTSNSALSSRLTALEGKEERVVIKPSYAACSKSSEDCSATGCCQLSGHTCYKKKKGAQCNKTCTAGKKGFTCEVVAQHSVPVQNVLGQNLYCFSVYTAETGSPKVSQELELLKQQKAQGASIFACEQWDVFSDGDASLEDQGQGYAIVKVEDTFNEFHNVKRKISGTWVNWALFYQVWLKVRELGKWEQADWTVKVDADAVFITQRLRSYLSNIKGDSPHGLYLENCNNVEYGFFGHLEVISRTGTQVLTKYLENCHEEFAPCADTGCDWKYGAWGEDVFAQRCMDHHYVDKVEAFDMTTDGACPTDRPKAEKKNKKWHAEDCSQVDTVTSHPYKKPDDYFKCLSEMNR